MQSTERQTIDRAIDDSVQKAKKTYRVQTHKNMQRYQMNELPK